MTTIFLIFCVFLFCLLRLVLGSWAEAAIAFFVVFLIALISTIVTNLLTSGGG